MAVFPNDKREISLPSSRKVGAPGGWPTSSLYEQEINSPQSQKLAVDSDVRKNILQAAMPTSQPMMVLSLLKSFMMLIEIGIANI